MEGPISVIIMDPADHGSRTEHGGSMIGIGTTMTEYRCYHFYCSARIGGRQR